jgi:50S ribosomal subunit-associated GTPase HflX
MNKADAVEPSVLEGLCLRHDAVAVSALKREGLDRLLSAAEALIH